MPRARKPPVKKVAKRSDGWGNALTGVGSIGMDKRRYSKFFLDLEAFVRQNQEEIWQGDDISARAIELIPDEMMRGGFELNISDSDKQPSEELATPDNTSGRYDTPPGDERKRADAFPPAGGTPPPPQPPPQPVEIDQQTTKSTEDAVLARYEELRGAERFLEALYYQRAYGGSAMLLGADDGQVDLTKPLNLDNIKSFKWVNVFTPRELQAVRYYSDPGSPRYSEPEIYRVMPDINMVVDMSTAGGPSTRNSGDKGRPLWITREIHESRLIIFCGPLVSKRHRLRNHGWGDSILVRLWQVICDFNASYGSAAHLLTDFSQAVLKIKGLAEIIAQNDDDALAKRAQLIDMSRSVARAVIIDSEEEFERKSTTVTGLPDLLMRFEHRLATAVGVPVSVFFGREPSGLNATGDAELECWYNALRHRQQKDLRPQVERFLRLIMLAKDGPTGGVEPEDWTLEFAPLTTPSDAEQGEIRNKQAQTDKIYIDSGVLIPEEVAQSRFGGRKWSDKTALNNDMRQKAVQQHQTDKEAHAKMQEKAVAVAAKAPPKAKVKPARAVA